MTRRRARIVGTGGAAVLSLVAAGTHAAVSGSHFTEWWGYGAFFVVASTAQGLLALVLFALTVESASPAPSWWRMRQWVLEAGIVGNAAIVAMWGISRTVGVPVGPGAGTVEAIGAADVLASSCEILMIGVFAWLLAKTDRAPAAARRASISP